MANSESTKLRLALELKRQARTMPLRRIKISELCTACGLDRRTFYYHFRDVYDLTAWVYNHDMDEVIARNPQANGAQVLALFLRRLQEEGCFYRRALAEDSQNSLGRHFLSRNIQSYDAAYQQKSGGETIPPEAFFAIRYHCFGALGMVRRWLFDNCVPGPEELAEHLIANMPPTIRWLYGLPER